MFSSLSEYLWSDLRNEQLWGHKVGRGIKIDDASKKRDTESLLQSIRTLGYSSLKPPGATKTMQQIQDEANEQPSIDAYRLNDDGFVAEESIEDNFDESAELRVEENQSRSEEVRTPPPLLQGSIPMLIPSPVLRQPTSLDDMHEYNGNSWNTTYTEDESYNESEYIQQGFMPMSDPPAFITPRRISSRPR